MTDQKKEFEMVYNKYLSNQATANELNFLFEEFGRLSPKELNDHIATELSVEEQKIVHDSTHLKDLLAKIEQKITDQSKTKTFRLNPWYKASAVAAVLILLSYLTFNTDSAKDPYHILPGKNKALLWTGKEEKILDGKTITKRSPAKAVTMITGANGMITYRRTSNDTTGLSKLHQISTPVGGAYKIKLSDGTEVYLNAKSSLEFPVGFYGATRNVKLNGEAYFKVASNKTMPFIVTVGETNVQVLGTSFMINNFNGEARTTLFEGSVQIKNSSGIKFLSPGEEALSGAGGIIMNKADTAAAIAWTKGMFSFNNQPLCNVLEELSRWYDFSFSKAHIPNINLYIKLSRNTDFQEVLQMLSATTGLKFKIEERRLIIK